MIFYVTTFSIICTSNFDTKCVRYTMETPHIFVEVLNFHKHNLTFHKTIKALTMSNKILMSYTKVWTTHNIVQIDSNYT
jgi:hypothetical protein